MIPRILVVDDEEIARENVVYMLEKDSKYEIFSAADGGEAIKLVQSQEFDLVLTDLRMKGHDGIAVLSAVKKCWPDCEVIIITGYATISTAVEAMQKGAYHYLAKPVNMDELFALVQKALEKRALKAEISKLRKQVASHAGTVKIIGHSPTTQLLKESIEQVAQLDCNVLIQGETGTGKELVARVIHELSARADKKFVAFNCGAFTEELITSELFGYEKGAFTGAGQVKRGLLEMADGGTVFFDEVGELSLAMQVKLLRFLQERTFMRVGGTKEISVDVRILAATNKDLKKESEEGTFRVDLFYRLDVLTIQVPPLAKRKEDIPLLVNHFLAKHSPNSAEIPKVSSRVIETLLAYEYPGNIRELENISQRLLLHSDGDLINGSAFDRDLPTTGSSQLRDTGNSWPSLEEHEKNYILEVLDEVEGNKSKAAKILKIDRVSLWRKIKRYGLDNPD
ncbi:sigma-54-dependent transcriptional regulator [Desulfosediminicola ganghwensis]|uniref:sigma-54-dependent transcriptional regulator n=1 Tax=Desulfosediminicola ganghwensis TaxID=2569540 RepID=UPI0010ACF936|nr:sigma-54 dependent transcriptional regulator [Desulfosediminicola ganghwensis]